MRPASQTSRGTRAREIASDTSASHVSAVPSAIRTGITIGAQNGTYDSHTTSGLSGDHGATLMAMT